jgi:endo-1,4-beta-xylanase
VCAQLVTAIAVVACLALLASDAAPVASEGGGTEDAIRRVRMGTIRIQCRPGAQVKVTQLQHEFWFGTAISRRMFGNRGNSEEREKYLQILKENFNSAVHENALKWYSTERRQGETSFADADRMLEWCEQNGIRMRGHCLFWAIDKYVQDWVKGLDADELRQTVERRAREVTSRYRGRILEYDVNNEMVDGRFYADKLGDEIRARMFQWAHEGDPQALLFVNDYSILSGRHLDAYIEQIKGLQAMGAPVGGIGVQAHFDDVIDIARIKESLDRLAQLGLPIRVTEFDVNTDDEARKAQFVGDFYRTCFAHPACEGILMWGFWEGSHWRPKAALWKRDFTPTPAALVYQDLVFHQWWTRWEGKADANGVCEVPAFFGTHMVEVNGAGREVPLRKSAGVVRIDCTQGGPDAWSVLDGE